MQAVSERAAERGTGEQGALEQALAAAQEQASLSLRATTILTRDLKHAHAGARDGQIRNLRAAVAAARRQWQAVGEQLTALEAAYDVDEAEHLTSGAYVRELLAESQRLGVVISVDPDAPDRLLSYPSVVRILPGDAAVEVDKRRDRRLRPSGLVARLGHAQQRPPRFKAAAFLEALASGYDFVVARAAREPGAVVRLDEVWSVLTVLPGSRSDYGKPEFARDLYLLDQSGTTTTRDRRRLRFAASTGTRGTGVLTTVARGGQQQLYWGVALTAGHAS